MPSHGQCPVPGWPLDAGEGVVSKLGMANHSGHLLNLLWNYTNGLGPLFPPPKY